MKKSFRAVLIAVAMAAALALTGCTKITGVTLGEDVTLNAGETAVLTPSYSTEKEASAKDVAAAAAQLKPTWTSSDDTIATVDSAGVVTAAAAGTAEITLAAGEYTDSVTVTVEQPVESIAAEDMVITTASDPIAPNYTIAPANATEKAITLTSADTSILSIQGGKLQPVTAGTTDITITAASGAKATCAVTVQQAPTEITMQDITVTAGKTTKITLTTTPAKCDVGNTWTYAVSDTAIAKVADDGTVTGVAAGKATLNVTNELGQTVTCTVTVNKAAAKTTTKTNGTTSATASGTGSTAAAATTSGTGTTTSPAQQPAPAPDPAPAPAPDPAPGQVIHDSPGVQLDPSAGDPCDDLT